MRAYMRPFMYGVVAVVTIVDLGLLYSFGAWCCILSLYNS